MKYRKGLKRKVFHFPRMMNFEILKKYFLSHRGFLSKTNLLFYYFPLKGLFSMAFRLKNDPFYTLYDQLKVF